MADKRNTRWRACLGIHGSSRARGQLLHRDSARFTLLQAGPLSNIKLVQVVGVDVQLE